MRSPLHAEHVELGARFTDFGGWEMPLQYRSVLAEHRAVRESAGVFDVTHLGRFELTGPGAHSAIRRLLCNDIERVTPGRCQYTMILNENGGIIDDLIVWWWNDGHFWVLPNAANHARVMALFDAEPDTTVHELRQETVMLAVQGPDAPDVLETVLGQRPQRFVAARVKTNEFEVAMAGTGYTGEPGAEVCVDHGNAAEVLRALLDEGVVACGLGCRDTLRLEAGLSLWGEDIDESTTPLEAGLGFAVSLDHEFVGREALSEQKEAGLPRKLVGLILDDRGVPRHGYRVRSSGGSVGEVTSGNMSPMLGQGVALAYMSPPIEPEEALEVEIREKWVPAHQAKPPFHK